MSNVLPFKVPLTISQEYKETVQETTYKMLEHINNRHSK